LKLGDRQAKVNLAVVERNQSACEKRKKEREGQRGLAMSLRLNM
jgi:hypothetical protein